MGKIIEKIREMRGAGHRGFMEVWGNRDPWGTEGPLDVVKKIRLKKQPREFDFGIPKGALPSSKYSRGFGPEDLYGIRHKKKKRKRDIVIKITR